MPKKLSSDGPFWVVTTPFKGMFDFWPDCLNVLTQTPGQQRQMKVETREEAEAILSGGGVILPLGSYVFIDGNALVGSG